MKTHWNIAGLTFVIGLGGLVLALPTGCGEDRRGFASRDRFSEVDASGSPGECLSQCSIDGRSRLTVCGGNVIESVACPSELACGGGTCQEPCAAAAADRSSNGCEFYIHPPRYGNELREARNQSCYAAYVVNTSNQDATVSLEYKGQVLDISKSFFRTEPGSATLLPHTGPLLPGEGAILFVADRKRGLGSLPEHEIPCPDGVVPAAYIEESPLASRGTAIGSSFHLSANIPVSLASIYPFGGALSYMPLAMLHLPVSAWAKEHVIVNALHGGGTPVSVIVASEDDTEVSLLPTVDLQDGDGVVGGPAGALATFRLGRGQNLQLVQVKELTGSIVRANKPVTTFGGSSAPIYPDPRPGPVEVPRDCCVDVVTQQIPALEQWGSEYVGIGYRSRTGEEHEPVLYRIVAAVDGTQLDYDPPSPPAGAPVTLAAGESKSFYAGTGVPFVVRTQDANHPIHVGAYMTSGGGKNGRWGDPEFVNVVPTGQYLNAYAFYADPTYRETSLVIVRAKSAGRFHDVWLECAGNLTGFRPIGARGDYEYVKVDLSRGRGPGDSFDGGVCQVGMQRMRSEGPFSATLWGWDTEASYAYPGGVALRKLVKDDILTR